MNEWLLPLPRVIPGPLAFLLNPCLYNQVNMNLHSITSMRSLLLFTNTQLITTLGHTGTLALIYLM